MCVVVRGEQMEDKLASFPVPAVVTAIVTTITTGHKIVAVVAFVSVALACACEKKDV